MSKRLQGNYNRWYDKTPEMANAFSSFHSMSAEYRGLFGHIILTVTKRLREQTRMRSQGFLSLGSDRVIGLMKSQRKRRFEDQDKLLHKALTDLFLLDDSQRTLIADRIYTAICCTNEYITACKRLQRPENVKEVTQLILETFEKGLRGGERHLMVLGLYDDMTSTAFGQYAQTVAADKERVLEMPKVATQKAKLVEDTSGMKIQRLDPPV